MTRWGLSIPLRGLPLAAHRDALRAVVDLGYSEVWSQETDGHDAFTPLACAAAWAPELRIGTAIASVFTRGPALLAMRAAALADAAPGRFALGIGSSSRPMVEGWNGIAFERPYARVRDTLRFLRAALAGERIERKYETFACHGFRLACPPAPPPPILLGALGPRMLALAGAEADGVLLSLVGPQDVSHLLAEVRAARPAAAAEPEVVMRIGVVVSRDAEAARAQLRRVIAAYLNVDRYAALHRWLGRGEQLAPLWEAWGRGDRRAAVARVSDELVDTLFVHGTAAQCREGIERFVAAGVTTPVVSIMRWDGSRMAAIEGLAPSD